MFAIYFSTAAIHRRFDFSGWPDLWKDLTARGLVENVSVKQGMKAVMNPRTPKGAKLEVGVRCRRVGLTHLPTASGG